MPNQPACYCIFDYYTDQYFRCLIQLRGPDFRGIWQSVELKENTTEKHHATLRWETQECVQVTVTLRCESLRCNVV